MAGEMTNGFGKSTGPAPNYMGSMGAGFVGNASPESVAAAAPQPGAQGQGKKSAGKAPDYTGAAQQQSAASQQAVQQQTLANRPNVNTPFGFQQWQQGPNGTWNLSSGFNGGLGQGAQALQGQAGQALSQGLEPSLFGAVGNGDAARNQAISASYGQATSRLNPQWDQRQSQLQAQLANQGLDPNSQAYRTASEQFGRDRNDAYGSALNSAIGQGTEAGSAVFGQNMASHQQALADALRQREAPIQEMQQLQGLTATPQFQAAGASDPTQYLAAAMGQGNYQLQDAQQQNQMWGQLIGGLFGLGGKLGGAAIGG